MFIFLNCFHSYLLLNSFLIRDGTEKFSFESFFFFPYFTSDIFFRKCTADKSERILIKVKNRKENIISVYISFFNHMCDLGKMVCFLSII